MDQPTFFFRKRNLIDIQSSQAIIVPKRIALHADCRYHVGLIAPLHTFFLLLLLFLFLLLLAMAGRPGYPKISGRVFRVLEISGFQKCYPKFG